MPSLLDLSFFKEIEEGFRFAKPSEWAELQIEALPKNAAIVGKMPEALIGLLMLYFGAVQEREDKFMKLVKEGSTYTDEQIAAYQAQLVQLQTQTRDFDTLFWAALCHEFNLDPDEDEIRYTSDYEVYILL